MFSLAQNSEESPTCLCFHLYQRVDVFDLVCGVPNPILPSFLGPRQSVKNECPGKSSKPSLCVSVLENGTTRLFFSTRLKDESAHFWKPNLWPKSKRFASFEWLILSFAWYCSPCACAGNIRDCPVPVFRSHHPVRARNNPGRSQGRNPLLFDSRMEKTWISHCECLPYHLHLSISQENICNLFSTRWAFSVLKYQCLSNTNFFPDILLHFVYIKQHDNSHFAITGAKHCWRSHHFPNYAQLGFG